jgi:hypothetical protein
MRFIHGLAALLVLSGCMTSSQRPAVDPARTLTLEVVNGTPEHRSTFGTFDASRDCRARRMEVPMSSDVGRLTLRVEQRSHQTVTYQFIGPFGDAKCGGTYTFETPQAPARYRLRMTQGRDDCRFTVHRLEAREETEVPLVTRAARKKADADGAWCTADDRF